MNDAKVVYWKDRLERAKANLERAKDWTSDPVGWKDEVERIEKIVARAEKGKFGPF